jgi:hypothetical protein
VAHLTQILFVDVVIGFAFLFGVMVIVGGLRWDDIRDVVLHDAYKSFTFEGDRIPGLAPGPLARTLIRLFSDPDDRRLRLLPEVSLLPAPRYYRTASIDRRTDIAVFRAR